MCAHRYYFVVVVSFVVCFDFVFVGYYFDLNSDQGVCGFVVIVVCFVLFLFFTILLPAHKLPWLRWELEGWMSWN